MDRDLRDNAAGRMLNGFDVGLNDQIARHRDGPDRGMNMSQPPASSVDKEERPQTRFAIHSQRRAPPASDAIAGFVREVRDRHY